MEFLIRLVHAEGSEAIAQNEKDVEQLQAIGFVLEDEQPKPNKALADMTKAELLAVAKERGIAVNPQDKKEIILAAVSVPDQQ